jgi:cytochrome c biogenesis protein CcmG/thiol:disulfide interchange protein DsbE
MRASIRIRKAPVIIVALVVAALVVLALVATKSPPKVSQPAFSPSLDPGTQLHGVAPGFTLTDQFDKQVSLSSFRGKVVLLAFNDSECTTICPLTTTAMVDAKRMLGAAGSKVALLGVDANPRAISVKDVRSYSELHGMIHSWDFGTGSYTQLHDVWKAYHIAVEIEAGQIDHTPALFVISPQGRLERLYLTQMSYASVTQQAQILAREAARLLPGHPAVHSRLSYKQIKSITPAEHATAPLVGHGSIKLGPGSTRLLLFFASWDQEVMNLKSHLQALSAYEGEAAAKKLPKLVAVDEGSVEPNHSALPHLLDQLPSPLSYPVAIDSSGRLADGYGVQDEPWLVLISRNGTPLWYRDVSTAGWLTDSALIAQVKAALETKSGPTSPAVVKRELAGSPPALASIHAQSDRLLGGIAALKARIRALRGYPIVLNFWYSTCAPCRAEFGLLASASAQFGRRVAFLGADVSDPGDAHTFLMEHPVSYPSYPISLDDVQSVLPQGLTGTPTTVFYNAAGKQVYVHPGQYESQGTLDLDVNSYALGG